MTKNKFSPPLPPEVAACANFLVRARRVVVIAMFVVLETLDIIL